MMKIITYPNDILRKKSVEVPPEEILNYQKILPEMTDTMLVKDGIGLAAPQIGKNIRLVIINKEAGNTKDHLILFNPEITFFSNKTTITGEGCLSVPGISGNVERPVKIRFKALNEKGEKIKMKANGMLARVVQHEVDHLNGILFIDKLTK